MPILKKVGSYLSHKEPPIVTLGGLSNNLGKLWRKLHLRTSIIRKCLMTWYIWEIHWTWKIKWRLRTIRTKCTKESSQFYRKSIHTLLKVRSTQPDRRKTVRIKKIRMRRHLRVAYTLKRRKIRRKSMNSMKLTKSLRRSGWLLQRRNIFLNLNANRNHKQSGWVSASQN